MDRPLDDKELARRIYEGIKANKPLSREAAKRIFLRNFPSEPVPENQFQMQEKFGLTFQYQPFMGNRVVAFKDGVQFDIEPLAEAAP